MPSPVCADTGYRNTVTLDVAGAPDIVLNGLNGDVRLTARNTNRVHILAQLRAESQKNLEQMSVKTSAHGQSLQIDTVCPQSGYWLFHIARCSVDYTITYPRNARIAIHNDNGDVIVDGATADIQIQNSHGDVLTTLAHDWHGASVSARTSMGDIRLNVPSAFTGHLKAKTWFGDVTDRARLGSGDVGGASVMLQTRFGDITVTRA